MEEATIAQLPPRADLETPAALKQAALAHRYLAELKGLSRSIPNQSILLNTLALQESKDSSEIENIITTHDEMYQSNLDLESGDPAVKEVRNYSRALFKGFEMIRADGFLGSRHILAVHEILEGNSAGYRKQPGTRLRNESTGEIVYTPPQSATEIQRLMKNLEDYINDDSLSDVDPLIKLAVIHRQFESIHPFYDGNGRAGRIINILYLVLKGLLDIPVLYLSRFIIGNKPDYYRLLQNVRETGEWESWLWYMLRAVEKTAFQSIQTVEGIRDLMMVYKHKLRDDFKFYSQDLLNHLFQHPYTKVGVLERELGVSRVTASKYLDTLAVAGLLEKRKVGRDNFFINTPLFSLLTNLPE